MRNLVEISTYRIDYKETIEHYEDQGFSYVSSHVSPEQNKTGEITIVFEGSREDIAEISDADGHRSFLQFDDGTESPLYIKRERNFWED